MPHILSLRVALPRNHAPAGEPEWRTAIFKEPVTGPLFLSKTGFDGDGVADRRYHGGPEKAALCYSAGHYPKWREELGLPMHPGGFGENLCIDGLDEESVCIGDICRIGEAEVQISQPRGPCSTLARRWSMPDLVRIVKENHRSGWYIRVLKEGMVAPGNSIELMSRPQPAWTIARAAHTRYSRARKIEDLRELVSLPELSVDWKSDLKNKIAAGAGN